MKNPVQTKVHEVEQKFSPYFFQWLTGYKLLVAFRVVKLFLTSGFRKKVMKRKEDRKVQERQGGGEGASASS
jgi:hypothetical protein